MNYHQLEILQEIITPWISEIITRYPYIIFVILGLLYFIIAFLQRRKTKKKTTKKQEKKKQAPKKIEGYYQNYKGEAWNPEGQRWNKEKNRWEAPDFHNEET